MKEDREPIEIGEQEPKNILERSEKQDMQSRVDTEDTKQEAVTVDTGIIDLKEEVPEESRDDEGMSKGEGTEDMKEAMRTIKTAIQDVKVKTPAIDVGKLRAKMLETKKEEAENPQPTSDVWKTSNDSKNSSLPLITVQLSIDEVDKSCLSLVITKRCTCLRRPPGRRENRRLP